MIEDIDLAKSICDLAVRLGDGAEVQVNGIPLRIEVQPDDTGYVGMIHVKFFSGNALIIESRWCGERPQKYWTFPDFGYIDTGVPCEGAMQVAHALKHALDGEIYGCKSKSAATLRKMGLTVHGQWY